MRLAIPNLYQFPNYQRTPAQTPERETPSPKFDPDTVTLGTRSASLRTDALAVIQFAGSGLLYKDSAVAAAKLRAEIPPFSTSPKVRLEDPFLIAPGWTTKPDKFDDLIGHLTKDGLNGGRAVYIKQGQAYSDQACTEATEIVETDKVFLAVYDDVLSPPDITGPQLAETTQLIKAKMGPKVDILGYSMGGVAVRKMLDSGESADQVAFLGTPHQGTRFAELADYVIKRDIGFAMKLGNINQAHLPTMAWMKPVSSGNENLGQLNATVDRQIENTSEMLNIAADGFATIKKPWGGTVGGDALVEASSTHLEGVPTTMLSGRGNKQHGALPSDDDAFEAMKNFFDWQTA